MVERSSGFFDTVLDRTLNNLRNAWRDISDSARNAIGRAPRPELAGEDGELLREQMRNCLEGRGGEVSGRARAADLGRTYLALDQPGRLTFLRILAESFDIDRSEVAACCARLVAADERERPGAERVLRRALEPPRIKLLTQFNALPEGVKFLVDMRAELMGLSRDHPSLAGLELDLKSLLAGWFDIGFLELRRITWEAPAALLEKLIFYEAVHEIRGWTDLKNRLEADRRCFAFFHPRMRDEPLIFVEVALVRGMSGSIEALLDESAPLGNPTEADAAIFYSISNCQKGLAGISFGNFLIKRVVDSLRSDLPRLKIFATLSPIPGFGAWLDPHLADGEEGMLTPAERRSFDALPAAKGQGLRGILVEPGWHRDAETLRLLKQPMLRLCAHYLLEEKTATGRVRDPVAHFHLSNGARLERLNWAGDLSLKGIQQSAGMMINYLYKLSEIEENHEAYIENGRVSASSQVRSLLRS